MSDPNGPYAPDTIGARFYALTLEAAALVDELGSDAAPERTWWYRLGYEAGRQAGWNDVLDEIERAEAAYTKMRAEQLTTPAYAELQRRRYPPDGDPDAWVAAARADGYRGGPVPWEPAPALRAVPDEPSGQAGAA